VTGPELSRVLRLSEIGGQATAHPVEANEAERAALAQRFGLLSLERLSADLRVRREAAGVRVSGRIAGRGVQPCVVSGLPVAAAIDEPLDLLFAEGAGADRPDEEVELGEADLDVLPLEGGAVDLGEAVAQSLGLALDPYPRAPEAELAAVRSRLLTEEAAADLEEADRQARNPFAALKRPR